MYIYIYIYIYMLSYDMGRFNTCLLARRSIWLLRQFSKSFTSFDDCGFLLGKLPQCSHIPFCGARTVTQIHIVYD